MKKALAVIISLLVIVFAVWLYKGSQSMAIRIGLNPWPGYEPIKLAETLGFFKKNGLDVRVLEYQSLNDVKVALLRGQVDIMCSTVIEAIELRAIHDLKTKIILVADYSNGADVIQSSKIDSIGALAGATVGLEFGTISEFLLRRAAQIQGLGMDQLTIKPMEQHDMLQALKEGQVDAVVSYPPVSLAIANEASAKTLFHSGQIPYEVIDILAAREGLVEQNPGLVPKIHQAWGDVLDYLKKNPKDAISRMAARQGISSQDFADALADLELVPEEEQERLLKTESEKLVNIITGFFEVLKAKDPTAYDPRLAGDFILP